MFKKLITTACGLALGGFLYCEVDGMIDPNRGPMLIPEPMRTPPAGAAGHGGVAAAVPLMPWTTGFNELYKREIRQGIRELLYIKELQKTTWDGRKADLMITGQDIGQADSPKIYEIANNSQDIQQGVGVYHITGGTFNNDNNLHGLIISRNGTELDTGAIDNCANLEFLILLGNGVMLRRGAIRNCPNLKVVIVRNMGPGNIEDNAFENCPQNIHVYRDQGFYAVQTQIQPGMQAGAWWDNNAAIVDTAIIKNQFQVLGEIIKQRIEGANPQGNANQ